jgi:L-ribulokinase
VTSTPGAFLGLDFGTESIRAAIVDASGRQLGVGVSPYAHGQIVPGSSGQQRLFPKGLAPDVALQHPGDWLESMTEAVRSAMAAGGRAPDTIGGIGVSFTSCTMLPTLADSTPLCESMAHDPHAWPKLWKHHGAGAQTARLNDLASRRAEPWLARYGGIVGLEWLIPKILEVVET